MSASRPLRATLVCLRHLVHHGARQVGSLEHTLTLTGSSNYSGSTTVSNGTLSVSGGGTINGTSSVITQSGGLLDVSNGAVTVADGGTFGGLTNPRARVR